MKKIVLIISITIIGFSWLGCQNKKEEIVFPTSTCDTSSVKYSTDIVGILQANCYSCHSNAAASSIGGGNRLEGYTNVAPYANSKLLLLVVQHASGVSPMPKNGAKLSDCNIAKIRTWIRNGNPNN